MPAHEPSAEEAALRQQIVDLGFYPMGHKYGDHGQFFTAEVHDAEGQTIGVTREFRSMEPAMRAAVKIAEAAAGRTSPPSKAEQRRNEFLEMRAASRKGRN